MAAPKIRKLTPSGTLGGFIGFVAMSIIAGLLVTAAVMPAVAMTGVAANSSLSIFAGLPSYLQINSVAARSTMYAEKNDKPVAIAHFFSEDRTPVALDKIAPLLQSAVIDTEDPRYYSHGAIDVEGTVRAALSDITGGGNTQGGSSITQQYVKNVRIQTCEKYDVPGTPVGKETQKQADALMQQKYHECYYGFTDDTISRKIQEAKLAIGVEKKYSKQQILDGYLNIVGFGGQVYGVEAAARYYFGTTADKVTLAQAATLAAIVNSPACLRIDENVTPANSEGTCLPNTKKNGWYQTVGRRNYVLRNMVKAGTITQAQADAATKTPITTKITPAPNGCSSAAKYDAAFYCETVLQEISQNKAFGKSADDREALLRTGGMKIYTPLNLKLQQAAQKSVSNWAPAARSDINLGASNVALELGTGRVVDMVQNRPWGEPKDNSVVDLAGQTATQVNYNVDHDLGGSAGFQTGSTYKLFSLIEWLKEGHSINDYIDAPPGGYTYPQSDFHATGCPAGVQTIDPSGVWKVGDDEGDGTGNMSILTATALSVNTAFSQMGTELNLCGIRQDAVDLGVHLAFPYSYEGSKLVPAKLAANPSSILGTNAIAPLTMAAAYAGVANDGTYCQPVFIDKIVMSNGKTHPVPQPDCHQAIDPNIAAGVIEALKGPVTDGTGQAANPHDGTPLIGKTGTTDGAAQNWLVTSTTKVAQATWVGNVQARYPSGCTTKLVYSKDPPSWCQPYYESLRSLGFNAKDGAYDNGGNLKLDIAKPIIAALDKVYTGATAFPTPESGSSVVTNTQTQVPSVAGQSTQQAEQILSAAGFSPQVGATVASAEPVGSAAGTSPAAYSRLSAGATVTIQISKGGLVFVPKLFGETVADAEAALSGAGFVPSAGSVDPSWTVQTLSPPAGTAVKPGATITIVATAPAASSPSSSSPPAQPQSFRVPFGESVSPGDGRSRSRGFGQGGRH